MKPGSNLRSATSLRNSNLLCGIVLLFVGCWSSSIFGQESSWAANAEPNLVNQESSVRPYALVLPGILGKRAWDKNVVSGIRQSGFPGDIEIYDWTRGPLMLGANIGGDSKEASKIAMRVTEFKTQFPSRPLYLVGHSGGCRMVVRVLESTKSGYRVERAILLSPGLESTYDLRPALNRTQKGIVVFYSPLDVPIPTPFTFAQGLTNGRLDVAAAAVGFKSPSGMPENEQQLYSQLLVQKKYDLSMAKKGHAGGHFGWTIPRFVREHVAPLLDPATNRPTSVASSR